MFVTVLLSVDTGFNHVRTKATSRSQQWPARAYSLSVCLFASPLFVLESYVTANGPGNNLNDNKNAHPTALPAITDTLVSKTQKAL